MLLRRIYISNINSTVREYQFLTKCCQSICLFLKSHLLGLEKWHLQVCTAFVEEFRSQNPCQAVVKSSSQKSCTLFWSLWTVNIHKQIQSFKIKYILFKYFFLKNTQLMSASAHEMLSHTRESRNCCVTCDFRIYPGTLIARK